ncbi:MAG: hypothetical protein J7K13_05415 [Thermoplasmata archaeon]|nr:hypothetical protein [Thermoplasmata archaeon]
MKGIYLALSLALSALLILPVSSASISQTFTDDTNDVMNMIYENSTINAPNVDISKITYYQSGKSVVITLEVVGNIDDRSIYSMAIETNVGNEDNKSVLTYGISYTRNAQLAEEMGYSVGGVVINDSEEEIPSHFSVQNNKKLRVSFDYTNFNEKPVTIDIFTYLYDETQMRFGLDWAEFNFSTDAGSGTSDDSSSDNGQEDNDSSDDGIPGFEITVLAVAVSISVLFLRKRL